MYTETYSLSFSVWFAIHKATTDFMASAGTAWKFKFELNPDILLMHGLKPLESKDLY